MRVERRRMAGGGERGHPGGRVRHEVEGRGKLRTRQVGQQARRMPVQLLDEVPGVASLRRKVIDERPDDGRDQRAARAVPHHVRDEDARAIGGERQDVVEIAAERRGRLVAVREGQAQVARHMNRRDAGIRLVHVRHAGNPAPGPGPAGVRRPGLPASRALLPPGLSASRPDSAARARSRPAGPPLSVPPRGEDAGPWPG